VFVTEIETTSPHRRERAVNRRVQGDIGEFSAMEWLTSKGALAWIPLGHSPDVDLIAEFEDRLLRVQVKTSTLKSLVSGGGDRWKVSISTKGGNRSWSGVAKRFDPQQIDYLFALVGDGRRWFIPADCVEANTQIALGGAKYSEFEIEAGAPFEALIYPDRNPNRIGDPILGECQSGQMERAVNAPATPTQVRILPPPSSRQVLLRPKRQLTIPREPAAEAGIAPGDRLRARADGPGRVVLERIESESG
jgi:PD-(D/E)XK endonuclease